MATKYAAAAYQDVVVAIELLNEPQMDELSGGRGATQDYYQNGFNTVRSVSNTPVVVQDGFVNPSEWNGFLTGTGSAGAIVDHHEYQVFTNAEVAMSPAAHAAAVCSNAQDWGEGQDKFVVVGEWTAAMTDCAAALVSSTYPGFMVNRLTTTQNGYGIGARYDGTYSKRNPDGTYESSTYVGSCGTKNFIDQWTPQMKSDTTAYINAQLDVFESKTQGWIFWNFKTEASAVSPLVTSFTPPLLRDWFTNSASQEWDLFRLLDTNPPVFPNLQGRQSTTICS